MCLLMVICTVFVSTLYMSWRCMEGFLGIIMTSIMDAENGDLVLGEDEAATYSCSLIKYVLFTPYNPGLINLYSDAKEVRWYYFKALPFREKINKYFVLKMHPFCHTKIHVPILRFHFWIHTPIILKIVSINYKLLLIYDSFFI